MEPPVPIPNTEVKRFSADDTEGATPWENKPLPGGFSFSPEPLEFLLPAGTVPKFNPLCPPFMGEEQRNAEGAWSPRWVARATARGLEPVGVEHAGINFNPLVPHSGEDGKNAEGLRRDAGARDVEMRNGRRTTCRADSSYGESLLGVDPYRLTLFRIPSIGFKEPLQHDEPEMSTRLQARRVDEPRKS